MKSFYSGADSGLERCGPVNSGVAANSMLAAVADGRRSRETVRTLLKWLCLAALAAWRLWPRVTSSNAPNTNRGGLHDVEALLSRRGDGRPRAAGPARDRDRDPSGSGTDRPGGELSEPADPHDRRFRGRRRQRYLRAPGRAEI